MASRDTASAEEACWRAVPRAIAQDPICRVLRHGWMGVWVLDVVDQLADAASTALSANEEAATARFRFAGDRALHRSAHLLKRWVHAAILGRKPTGLTYRYDAAGKPHLLGAGRLSFSLSHGGRFVAVAVSLHGSCGVDVEALDAVASARLPWQDLLHDAEQQRFACPDSLSAEAASALWTLKEAASKVIGLGLSLPPREIETPDVACGPVFPQSAPGLVVHRHGRCPMPASLLPLSDDRGRPHRLAVASAVPVRGFLFRHVAAGPWRRGHGRCFFSTSGRAAEAPSASQPFHRGSS